MKQVEAQTVAAIRDVLPTYTQIKYLYDELEEDLRYRNVEIIGLSQTLWHDAEYRLNDVDAEVVLPINQQFSGNGRVKSYKLPEVSQMACVIHHGSHDALVQAFNALLKWIESNNYQILGPNREIYWQPKITDSDFVEATDNLTIEIQFPVCNRGYVR